jgi:hypothetical protein
VSIPLQWEGTSVPRHLEIIQIANDSDDFFCRALHRVYPSCGASASPEVMIIRPLAVGGAMAVYKIDVLIPRQPPRYLVGKIPHERRITYAAGTDCPVAGDLTYALLERLVALAEQLAQRAPGVLPRSGGVWHGRLADGMRHLMVEEFIPGVSVERLKHTYDEQLATGQLSLTDYRQRRTAVERLAVAAYLRLWDGLGRRTFTSDPSPWNVLIRPSDTDGGKAPVATIIDLHSLEDHVGLTYILQRLAAVYGMRQEVLEEVILPGILDVLGEDEGRVLLQAELPQLEALARQTRQHLGVDLQQPLLEAIRNLC